MTEDEVRFENETRKHQQEVARMLMEFAGELLACATCHDATKLQDPERETFARVTPRLAGLTYGSEAYRTQIREMGPALAHHYKFNPHHPECHKDGIRGMCLVDVVEMFCDWWAATKRHNDGDIRKSIEINADRFGFGDVLKAILLKTVDEFEEVNDDATGH